jgi:hypothetical protein
MRRRDGDRKSFHDHRDRHRDDKYEGFKGRGRYDSYNRQRGRDYDRFGLFIMLFSSFQIRFSKAMYRLAAFYVLFTISYIV